jgi:hypothetical protein
VREKRASYVNATPRSSFAEPLEGSRMGEPRLVAIRACVVAAVVLAIGVDRIVVSRGGYV